MGRESGGLYVRCGALRRYAVKRWGLKPEVEPLCKTWAVMSYQVSPGRYWDEIVPIPKTMDDNEVKGCLNDMRVPASLSPRMYALYAAYKAKRDAR